MLLGVRVRPALGLHAYLSLIEQFDSTLVTSYTNNISMHLSTSLDHCLDIIRPKLRQIKIPHILLERLLSAPREPWSYAECSAI